MIAGLGPQVAPRLNEISCYREAPIGEILPIRAYIGVPIQHDNGSIFGTLCAFDKANQSNEMLDELPLVELFATLLGSILECELGTEVERRRAERAEADSMINELTGLGNRRAWERMIDAEEARCARYGDPASILIIDINELKQENDEHGHAAGDQVLKAAADSIQSSEREGDFTARIGGDEFGFLALHANALDAETLRTRILAALRAHSVRASVGVATRHPSEGLRRAITLADLGMYSEKLRGRSS
ncbi:MAG TPA: sensor domain-containing diguanylate cyclase [Acidimicrobiales bacterium]|nr:sensor domain-containing diguanylate cyclase [Acidimicrobiales bacterium]